MKYLRYINESHLVRAIERTADRIENLIEDIKQYSYIMEDEGIKVEIWRNSSDITIFLIKENNKSDLSKFLNSQDYFIEYFDRIFDICKTHRFSCKETDIGIKRHKGRITKISIENFAY